MALRSFDWPRIEAWRPFIWHLEQALDSLSARSTVVLRGIKLGEATDATVASFLEGEYPPNLSNEERTDTTKYNVNSMVLWPSFSSTTHDFAIAMEYGTSSLKKNEAAIIFKMHTRRVKAIKQFSYYMYEEELLYGPNTAFRVTGLWQATTLNLRQGSQVAPIMQPFSISTEHLAQSMLSLEEAKKERILLITMVEVPLDGSTPELDRAAHQRQRSLQREFNQVHRQLSEHDPASAPAAASAIVATCTTPPSTFASVAPPTGQGLAACSAAAAMEEASNKAVEDENFLLEHQAIVEQVIAEAVDTALRVMEEGGGQERASSNETLMRIALGLITAHLDRKRPDGGVLARSPSGAASSATAGIAGSGDGYAAMGSGVDIVAVLEETLSDVANEVLHEMPPEPLLRIAMGLMRKAEVLQ